MPFNLNTFRTEISTNGIIHSHNFEVQLTLPGIIGTTTGGAGTALDTTTATNMLLLRAEAIRIPGILLKTADVARYGVGPNSKWPFSAGFIDTSFTFISDRECNLWTMFYLWLNAIFGFAGTDTAATGGGGTAVNTTATYQVAYKDDYVAPTMSYLIYTATGELAQTIQFYDGYPVSMNDMPLEWGETNNLLRITIGMTFREVTILGAGATAAPVLATA